MILQNLTSDYERQFVTPRWSHSKYHVIYMTEEGKDYCRQTLRATTLADAFTEAQAFFDRTADHMELRSVTAFRIENW